MPRLPGIDPLSNIVDKQYAIVYAPGKRRDRFPENCVQVVESLESALHADQEKHQFPALVLGPSRSSEDFRLYYLVEWLNEK